ncbi:MAG: SGNH/GDSL hydrolase family protein [Alistipes sp.]|nr:SGNH/GDSL hydrolase family protein [Alistipes sp.]
MKKLLLFILLLVAFAPSNYAAEKAPKNVKFVDAQSLNICGHTLPTEKSPFYRFDPEPYGFKEKNISRYACYPTGLYVMFRTNSSQVVATWENVPRRVGDNMTAITQLGLDLYIKHEGRWVFCQSGRVSTDTEKSKRTKTLVKNLAEGDKEFMLYLPLWCELKSLEIGIDENAVIEPIASPYKYKVLNYGTSITHGASASRPGMTWSARMSRNLGIDFINVGFSGQGKMQPEIIPLLSKVECDALLCYCFGNPSAKEIEERVDYFVDELVKTHPGKPIIFIRPLHNELDYFDMVQREKLVHKLSVINRKIAEIKKRHKDVYYLDEPFPHGDDFEGSVDKSHLNDLGFDRVIKTYQPKIAKILRKYGIK